MKLQKANFGRQNSDLQILTLSTAVYVCTITSPSRQFLDRLSLLKGNFIWAGKSAKIKHSTLIGSSAEGGYRNVDIESKFKSLKIICIKRLLDESFHPWNIIPSKLFSFTGMSSVFCQNSNSLNIALSGFLVFRNFIRN